MRVTVVLLVATVEQSSSATEPPYESTRESYNRGSDIRHVTAIAFHFVATEALSQIPDGATFISMVSQHDTMEQRLMLATRMSFFRK